MKMDYKLYLSIIFAIAICFVLFLGYAHWAPNLPTDKDVLSNWITVLIFLVTVSAGVMPFVLNDRQSRVENKLIEFEKNIESLTELQNKVIEVQSGIERIDKEYPNIMPILQNMGNALNNVMFSIAQFYADRFHEQMNHIFGIRSQLSYDDIKLLLDRMLNVLISIINANNKKIYMVEYPKLKHCIVGIKKRSSAEELAKAIKIICQTAEYRVLIEDQVWEKFLGEEEYPKFQVLF